MLEQELQFQWDLATIPSPEDSQNPYTAEYVLSCKQPTRFNGLFKTIAETGRLLIKGHLGYQKLQVPKYVYEEEPDLLMIETYGPVNVEPADILHEDDGIEYPGLVFYRHKSLTMEEFRRALDILIEGTNEVLEGLDGFTVPDPSILEKN